MFGNHSASYDIAIIGAGPVGLTAANLAMAHGLTAVVVEKEARPFPLPRAIHFNGDVLRVFQGVGLANMLQPQIGTQRGTTIYGADGEPTKRLHFLEDDSTGWCKQYSFYQPLLEATLRDNLVERQGIDVRHACEVVGMVQNPSGVTLNVSGASGDVEISARYVLACDGARSFARSSLQIEMENLGVAENWIVVDVFFDEGSPLPPDRTVIYSDPDQPAVYVPGPGLHRRFEWQLGPDEDPQAANTRENVARTLARWTDPDRVEIIRHAAYTFNAMIAETWRSGRIFLAGDAAHRTPPFLGQGMGHGVRDVSNLVWKIAAEIRGAAPALLESYEAERKPHVRTIIQRAIEVGRGMGIRDRTDATARDLAMRSAGPLDRTETDKLMPPVAAGFIGRGKAAGTAFPQPFVSFEGRSMRLDDVIGIRSAVITRCDLEPSIAERLATDNSVCWLSVSPSARAPGSLHLEKAEAVVAWFDTVGADIVVVRPDRCVFDHAGEAEAGEILQPYLSTIHVAQS
ncbi:3-(3-hydroxy-phenyl)propionate hydroxylase [Paraburkholderia sp. BL23I1N1]|uniref:bifunctional 3-(3-hydroxy-phenyl)propionate/3-hydroxycinnamic acid hydroxylase n=1 Tax=Paraburkholderia sp. BL23I1N1 TaxID=1938802 RepID=UPI000FF7BD66|nr:bifunctional 3-(3-hydroxy-phenyl)propionate/3-hydroxycinnamic acid hydroxylase [Paraburkholderia sp. BL23I1N1]RKE38574.1 3-(3-hydroxy-phenyl)propionate hydroxylase [Paraburkholderia sp. BL23I1N1]